MSANKNGPQIRQTVSDESRLVFLLGKDGDKTIKKLAVISMYYFIFSQALKKLLYNRWQSGS